MEIVLREKNFCARRCEPLLQQPRDGEREHRFLHGPVARADDEVAFFHPRPFAADVAGVESDSREAWSVERGACFAGGKAQGE